jgi:hypothetical protein
VNIPEKLDILEDKLDAILAIVRQMSNTPVTHPSSYGRYLDARGVDHIRGDTGKIEHDV